MAISLLDLQNHVLTKQPVVGCCDREAKQVSAELDVQIFDTSNARFPERRRELSSVLVLWPLATSCGDKVDCTCWVTILLHRSKTLV